MENKICLGVFVEVSHPGIKSEYMEPEEAAIGLRAEAEEAMAKSDGHLVDLNNVMRENYVCTPTTLCTVAHKYPDSFFSEESLKISSEKHSNEKNENPPPKASKRGRHKITEKDGEEKISITPEGSHLFECSGCQKIYKREFLFRRHLETCALLGGSRASRRINYFWHNTPQGKVFINKWREKAKAINKKLEINTNNSTTGKWRLCSICKSFSSTSSRSYNRHFTGCSIKKRLSACSSTSTIMQCPLCAKTYKSEQFYFPHLQMCFRQQRLRKMQQRCKERNESVAALAFANSNGAGEIKKKVVEKRPIVKVKVEKPLLGEIKTEKILEIDVTAEKTTDNIFFNGLMKEETPFVTEIVLGDEFLDEVNTTAIKIEPKIEAIEKCPESSSQNQDNVSNDMSLKLKCTECQMGFQQIEALEHHIRLEHTKQGVDREPDYSSDDSETKIAKRRVTAAQDSKANSRKKVCPHCNREYKNKRFYKEHKIICPQTSVNKKSMLQPKKTRKARYLSVHSTSTQDNVDKELERILARTNLPTK